MVGKEGLHNGLDGSQEGGLKRPGAPQGLMEGLGVSIRGARGQD